ncbi:hypothetical protein AHiyo6_34280, partial [Arthrobacter sp. Hiyo6]
MSSEAAIPASASTKPAHPPAPGA